MWQADLKAAPSCILVVIGLIDDRFELTATARLASQFAATLIMRYGAGLALNDIGDPFGTGVITMGKFTLLFTTLVTITMINAYNFVDGSDGLSGSLACIALVAVAIVGGLSSPAGASALIVAAAILGFLVFNLPMGINNHLRSFMGDAGSTLLGFCVVWTTIGISQGDARVISPVHCLWFAAIPIFDFMTCFARRIANRRSPFAPGRDHFHHILLRGGLSGRQALMVLAGFQLLYAAIGIFGYLSEVSDVAMFSAWAALGVTQRPVFQAIARYHRALRIRRKLERRKFAASTN
jgi:UDP-GlcNAc:undecaprenyl-phosphate GlcNAc-1-phosphate transferase